jgi:hypothetical protein
MCKKTLLTLAVLALASVIAFATGKDGIAVSKDGRMVMATKPARTITRSTPSDAGLVTIYGNIGTSYPKGPYWCCEASSITGPTALPGFLPEYWEASAFTPTADHSVTKVEVAVSLISGTNGLVLGLYNDASGVPGTAIKTWTLSGLPDFGSCCVVEAKGGADVPVKAGTQYWIVLKVNSKESTTWAAWNYNDTDQVDMAPTAFWCSDDKGGSCGNNNAWTADQSLPGLAFAVLGR